MSTLLANSFSVKSAPEEKERLLTQGTYEDHDELENVKFHSCEPECAKKHGIACRILTRLHLKHRKIDHQKLLSESQEHLTDVTESKKKSKSPKKKRNRKYELHIDDDDNDVHPRDSGGKISSKKEKKKRSKSDNLISYNNNHKRGSKSPYQRLGSKENLKCSCEMLPEASEEKPTDGTLPPPCGGACEAFVHIHEYGDVNFGEKYMTEDDSPLVEKMETDTQTTGQYIKHQWHGKRAKKARKRFRRAARATWMSLQTGLNMNNIFPNTTTVTAAFARRN